MCDVPLSPKEVEKNMLKPSPRYYTLAVKPDYDREITKNHTMTNCISQFLCTQF